MDPKTPLKKVVFLDRDGVINKDSENYIKSWAEFSFLPGSLDAIKVLTQKGFPIILITNQSMINRKIAPLKNLETIHFNLVETVNKNGGAILDIFYCPHKPDENCECRKPKPGLIVQAKEKYAIDLLSSVMVGDNAKDILCAKNAGCGSSVLVKSGLRQDVEPALAAENIYPDRVCKNLYEAAQWMIRTFSASGSSQ